MKHIYKAFTIISCFLITIAYVFGQVGISTGGVMYVASGTTMRVNTDFYNEGTLNNNSAINILGSYESAAGATTVNNGTLRFRDNFYSKSGYTGTKDVVVYTGNSVNTIEMPNQVVSVFRSTNPITIKGKLTIDSLLDVNQVAANMLTGDTLLIDSAASLAGSQIQGGFLRKGTGNLSYPLTQGIIGTERNIVLQSVPALPGGASPTVGVQMVGAFTGTPASSLVSLNNAFTYNTFIYGPSFTDSEFKVSVGFSGAEGVTDLNKVVVAVSDSKDGVYYSVGSSTTSGTTSNGTVTSEIKIDGGYVAVGESFNTKVAPRVFLGGPYVLAGDSMRIATMAINSFEWHDELVSRFESLTPQPHKMAPGFTVPDLAIDTINVSIRSIANGAEIENHTAWLLSNGKIVDFETGRFDYLTFANSVNGNYYVIVRHRNHLGAMTNTAVTMNVNDPPVSGTVGADLRVLTNVYGGGVVKVSPTKYALIPADVNYDGEVNANDLYTVSFDELSLLTGYNISDVNLDGSVNSQDRDKASEMNDNLYFTTIP